MLPSTDGITALPSIPVVLQDARLLATSRDFCSEATIISQRNSWTIAKKESSLLGKNHKTKTRILEYGWYI